MKKLKLYGIHKHLFKLKVKIQVGVYFFKIYQHDKKLKKFLLTLMRLNCFLEKFEHNKYAQIGDDIRMEMYVPGFPSKAFFTACNKFAVFNEKLPCIVALVSVTSACTYRCQHCYQRFDIGKDVDLIALISAVRSLQNHGVAFFNIEGGEPFLTYDRLFAVCNSIDDRSEIWINSTGNGITKERLLELKKTNIKAIMFSLHSAEPDQMNAFMGCNNAWDNMINAIELCHQTGISVAFNSCLPLEDFSNGNFEKVMQRAKDLGGFLIQLIKPKPSGGWLESGVQEYSSKDFEVVKDKVNMYNLKREYADFPSISAQIIEEDPDMFGCTAGGTDRVYINAKGDVQPCEFVNASFGNIIEEDFNVIFTRMRKAFETPQTTIMCEKYAKDIHKLYVDNHLKQLPLPKGISKHIFDGMKHNNPTKIYQKIETELNLKPKKDSKEA